MMDFQGLRKRWADALTGGEIEQAKEEWIARAVLTIRDQAATYRKDMLWDEDRTCLWPDLQDPQNVYRRDVVCLSTCRRIETMAMWYACGRCEKEERSRYLEAASNALGFISKNWYAKTIRKGGEWWHKEIGIPLCLNRCILFLYEEMDETLRKDLLDAVESFTDTPDWMCIEDTPEQSTGANRAWKCLALAQCGVLKESERMLMTASKYIRDVFVYTQSGDGFYEDGSFIQHLKFPYTGGYGVSFLETIVDYLYLVSETPAALDKTSLTLLKEWAIKSYEPLLWRGGMMSMVRGREIAREFSQEHAIGHMVIQAFYKLACVLDKEEQLLLKQKIKSWLLADTYWRYEEHDPIAMICQASALLADETITPYEFPPCSIIYPAMDRALHRRAGYALGISLHSERTGQYESIHEENLRGWYTADGMTYLYNEDISQFCDNYFPTVNAYRMPGTTVSCVERKEQGVGFGQEKMGHKDWVGGTVLDGLYGAVGMDLEAECSDLCAKKSWFLFDNELVCLGSGITSGMDCAVETIVANRKIDKDTRITVNDRQWSATSSLPEEGVYYVHLQGEKTGRIGYLFAPKSKVEIVRECREDSWYAINHNSGAKEMVKNEFVNIVIPHGVMPPKEGYQYMILPGISLEELKEYQKQIPIEVLQNDEEVQAVYHQGLHLFAGNFWTDKSCRVGKVTCGQKASVMIREKDGVLSVSVSDPTWKQQDIDIMIHCPVKNLIDSAQQVQVMQMQPYLQCRFHTKDRKGQTIQARFSL